MLCAAKLDKTIKSIVILFLIQCFTLPAVANEIPSKPQPIVMAYWENWGTYANYPMPNNAQGSTNRVLSEQLKGLNALAYAFLEITPNGTLQFSDVWSDLDPKSAQDKKFCGLSPESCKGYPRNAGLGNFSAFAKAPVTHHVISIGGENHDDAWENAIKHPDQFVSTLKMLVETYHIDWLDMDYEPVNGVPPENIQGLINLTNKIRQILPHLIISYAIPANKDNIKKFGKTNWQRLEKNLNYVSIMGYEMHGVFDKDNPYTALHSALIANDSDGYSDESALQALNLVGVKNDKIILGMPLYGSAVGGVQISGVGQVFTKAVKGDLDEETCSLKLAANNVCGGLFQYKTLVDKNYQTLPVMSDGKVVGVYAYDAQKKVFVSYDNPASAAAKAQYIVNGKLAGVMFWALRFDKPIHDPQSLLASVDKVLGIALRLY